MDNEIDEAWTSIPGIHDNGPCDHGVWRLTLTAYIALHIYDWQGGVFQKETANHKRVKS